MKIVKEITLALCALISAVGVSAADEIHIKFYGLKLGQTVPNGISSTSKTELN